MSQTISPRRGHSRLMALPCFIPNRWAGQYFGVAVIGGVDLGQQRLQAENGAWAPVRLPIDGSCKESWTGELSFRTDFIGQRFGNAHGQDVTPAAAHGSPYDSLLIFWYLHKKIRWILSFCQICF